MLRKFYVEGRKPRDEKSNTLVSFSCLSVDYNSYTVVIHLFAGCRYCWVTEKDSGVSTFKTVIAVANVRR